MKSRWICEFTVFCTALLSAIALSYFFYLKPTLHLAAITDKKYHQFEFNLLQLQQDQQSDNIISQQLDLLKQKDLSGYQIISQSDGNTGLLQIISQFVHQAGFTLLNARPLHNQVLLEISGDFKNLFILFDLLKQSAYPIELITLQMKQNNGLDIKLVIRGLHDRNN